VIHNPALLAFFDILDEHSITTILFALRLLPFDLIDSYHEEEVMITASGDGSAGDQRTRWCRGGR